jgi:Kef-type K+ transport system membrane component KefB
VDDVTAWCILAGVVAVARAGQTGTSLAGRAFVVTILGSAGYVLLMATAGRRLLATFARKHGAIRLTPQFVSAAVILALASAWVTERLGIHALFGAFLAGAIMPRSTDDGRPCNGQLRSPTVLKTSSALSCCPYSSRSRD